MSVDRTGGVPPSDPGRAASETKAAREERQKVEKVRAIDADEETQRRRKKFQMMMGDEDQPADLEPRTPSPFETAFYSLPETESAAGSFSATAAGGTFGSTMGAAAEAGLGGLGDDAIPSPAYSPPPNVANPPVEEDSDGSMTGGLPSSSDFWEDLDSPPDQPPQPQQFQETPQSASRSQPEAQPSPFGPPGKPAKGKAPAAREPGPGALATPSGKPIAPLAGRSQGRFEGPTGATGPSGKMGKKPGKPQKDEEETEVLPYSASRGEGMPASAFPGGPQEGGRKKGSLPPVEEKTFDQESRRGKERDVVLPAASLPQFPPDIQPIAQAAATQAAPYLSPETIPLYFQMVGTVYAMLGAPGAKEVDRTEFVLNNPAFADSKFYGSKITIEKYATAPDSLNIRLSGPDAAVSAFQQNIPSLMSAFQNGPFAFRVNRIEAEYAVERPSFRRKDKREEGGFEGGSRERRK